MQNTQGNLRFILLKLNLNYDWKRNVTSVSSNRDGKITVGYKATDATSDCIVTQRNTKRPTENESFDVVDPEVIVCNEFRFLCKLIPCSNVKYNSLYFEIETKSVSCL